MGASHANANPQLLDDSPWPLEEVGEDAVLAEFADETKLGSGSTVTPSLAVPTPVVPEIEPGNDNRRARDLLRTLALGCLSAMALGASFAIGFGYVWSDRTSLPATPDTTEAIESTPRPYLPGWWLPLPQIAPPSNAVKPPAQPAAPIHPSALRATAAAKPAKASRESAAGAVTPRNVADARPDGVTLLDDSGTSAAPAADTTARDPERASTSAQPGVLPSQAMVSGDMASAPTREWLASAESHGPARTSRNSVIAAIPPHSAPMSTASRADVDAVRQTIALYQSAYSQMDVGAMAAVWPSLDTASVERAFAGVDRQALTLNECRVTTAGNLATAVCPGQVRYIGRVGGRQMQERQGTWTIALERRGDAWQFVRLNVR